MSDGDVRADRLALLLGRSALLAKRGYGLDAIAPAEARGLKLETIVAFVMIAALWALCHPYCGILGDANVYIGRVIADLDPAGVGRDMMFVDDGQSKFSLFPLLARPIVRTIGTAQAAMVLAAAGSFCWFLALVAFAHALTAGRAAWAIVIAVSVLPVAYGDTGIFSFAETSALPRPFAEAAVLGAFAAIVRERTVSAAALLLVAMALHPIMALSGVMVMVVTVLWRMRAARRVIALTALGLGAALALTLGWLGFPLVDRLVARVDPEWMEMLVVRSPHLFPTWWTLDAVPPLVAETVTIVIAARCAPIPQRRLFWAVLITVAAALATSVVFADEARLLFVVQVQCWRATWLLAVVGGCAFAYSAPLLLARGNGGRLVLCALVLGWFVQIGLVFSVISAISAIILDSGRYDRFIGARVVVGAVAATCSLAACEAGDVVIGYLDVLKTYPADLPHLPDPLRNNIQTLPILILTVGWLFARPLTVRLAYALVGLTTLVLVGATIVGWDQRAPARPFLEKRQTWPASLTVGRPQEVLWLESRGEPWLVLGRPQYLSPQQAVSIVFSRKLGVEWYARARLLVALGLAQKAIFTPTQQPADDDRVIVTQTAIDTLCRRADAPGLVIVPIVEGAPPLRLRNVTLWPLPDPVYIFDRRPSAMRWTKAMSLGLVPCHPPIGAAKLSRRPAQGP